MSSSRQSNFDFTPPTHPGRITLYRAIPTAPTPRIWVFLEVFTWSAWLGMLVMTVILATMLLLIVKDTSPVETYNVIFAHYIQRDLEMSKARNPRSSARFVLWSSGWFGFLCYSAYSSDLTSFLTTRTTNIGITSLEYFLKNSDYKLNILYGSQIDAYLRNADPASIAGRVYNEYFSGAQNQ